MLHTPSITVKFSHIRYTASSTSNMDTPMSPKTHQWKSTLTISSQPVHMSKWDTWRQMAPKRKQSWRTLRTTRPSPLGFSTISTLGTLPRSTPLTWPHTCIWVSYRSAWPITSTLRVTGPTARISTSWTAIETPTVILYSTSTQTTNFR